MQLQRRPFFTWSLLYIFKTINLSTLKANKREAFKVDQILFTNLFFINVFLKRKISLFVFKFILIKKWEMKKKTFLFLTKSKLFETAFNYNSTRVTPFRNFSLSLSQWWTKTDLSFSKIRKKTHHRFFTIKWLFNCSKTNETQQKYI